nr:beta-flanking protein [Rhizopogon roseolus]
MDSFINLAKQGYEAYSESQSNTVHKTGGQEYNSYDNRPPQSQSNTVHRTGGQEYNSYDNRPPQSQSYEHSYNSDEVSQHVDSDNHGYMHQAMSHAHRVCRSDPDIDEDTVQNLRKTIAFTIAHTLSGIHRYDERWWWRKLFDQSGGGSGEEKQSAMNSAATYAMKLMMKKEMSGFIGGSNSGGLGSLMGMVRQFPICFPIVYLTPVL